MKKTPEQLLADAQAASDVLTGARETMRKEKKVEAALDFCKAFQDAKAARAALPPLRVVR